MASWVCNQDGTVFTVGADACPSPECRAQDAHEQGGDPDVNVFDLGAGDAEVSERLGLVPPAVEAQLVETGEGEIPKPREKRSGGDPR